jgi:ribosomal protein L20A (L18A)
MYTVLLRELDYAQDYDIANLEIELEAEGRLAKFVKICADLYRDQIKTSDESGISNPITLSDVKVEDYAIWQMVRKGAQKVLRTSAVMNQLDPKTNPNPDSWALSFNPNADITINTLVDRTFELSARRSPGKAIVFVIDEVGQYVARSGEKIENLRAVVEQYGKEGKNRVQANKAVAPVWIIVTSQEKLDEVVAAIDDKRVQLAKLQDRFRYRVDMAPADIREVATRRVLSKNDEAKPILQKMYQDFGSQIKAHTSPERSQISFDFSEQDFIQFYPYLPHFIELSIDIVSGMRLQVGAPRHIGGSNRTIIKQVYEMLVSGRTNLADAPVGTLVSIDRIFDLIGENLSSPRKEDIRKIEAIWLDNPWPIKIAKAIALLEFVRSVPRTEKNLSALLFNAVDTGSILPEVERAIGLLHEKQFIRQTEDGWKLLTDQEKNWTVERNSISPTPKERRDIIEDMFRTSFSEPSLSRYTMEKRTFKLDLNWEGRFIAQGEIPVELQLEDDNNSVLANLEQIRNGSREKPRQVFWVAAFSDEIEDQLRAQGKLNADDSSSLASEKLESGRHEERLKRLLLEALQQGTGFFNGVSKNGPDMGTNLPEILKGMLDYAVPKLYDKLKMGSVPVKGTEADEILKAVNLNGLSKVFYAGPDGLKLVVTEGGKTIIQTRAEIALEVMGYLQQEHSYGNKVTGRILEDHFGGLGYGWSREVQWIVLAALLRAGVIEVTYQGRRFRNHLDPQVRSVFASTNTFRSASFAPRKAPDLKTLVNAAKRYEEITGEEVDVDEAAIAQAFQKLAQAELNALLPVDAIARANDFPVLDILDEYQSTLKAILQGASDDLVNMLEGEGESFKKLRSNVQGIHGATEPAGIKRLQRARIAATQMAGLLIERGVNSGVGEAKDLLKARLADGSYYQTTVEVDQAIQTIESTYSQIYSNTHIERSKIYREAIDQIKGSQDFVALDSELQKTILVPLTSRDCDEGHDSGSFELTVGTLICESCKATIPQMESDIAAASGLSSSVMRKIQVILKPEEKVERVRISAILNSLQTLNTREEVDQALEHLREALMERIDAGVKVILE